MKFLQSLSPINKKIVDNLKTQSVIVEELDDFKFKKKVGEYKKAKGIPLNLKDVERTSGYYEPDYEHVLIRKNVGLISKEYLLMHEIVHAIRDTKRADRIFIKPKLPRKIKNKIAKLKLPEKTFAERKFLVDSTSWREEAVADCVSIFLCNQYGSTRRSAISLGDKERIIFMPLWWADVYSEKEREEYLKTVRKECLYTIEYIFGHYLSDDNKLWDKKMVISHFDVFFSKEVERCRRLIKKLWNKFD